MSSLKMWSVLVGILVAMVLIAVPAMAHGHEHSVNCLFQIEGVQVQVDDLGDGVIMTMTSDDEKVITRLQKSAWEQVEQDEGARKHDCFFHMAGVQVLVKDVHNGVILTITSTDEDTIAKLQEMARWKTRDGCRHDGQHKSHH